MASKNYVNNAEFYRVMVEYKTAVDDAAESGEEPPVIPNYVGECIYQISNRLARKPNFSGYTYKDEMISDGLENAIMAINNFNPEKSQNPFAYFTQIIYYAFLRRIQKEKKQMYVRHKVMENSVLSGTSAVNTSGNDDTGYIDLDNEYMSNFVKDYEDKLEEKKRKKVEPVNTTEADE